MKTKSLAIFVIFFFSLLTQAKPGDLVSLKALETTDPSGVLTGRKNYCPSEVGQSKAYGFKSYKIEYRTLGLHGEEVTTAGLIQIPDAVGPFPLFVYQHGTLIGRAELPSQYPKFGEGRAAGFCYTSLGYVSVLADYLGYGDSTGVHPYLHADSEAWVARDLMRAAQIATAQLKISLSSKIFIAGYSQGGHAAMSLLRFLEQDPQHEFHVTAAAPMAGPYHLSETIAKVLEEPAGNSAVEGAFLVVGLNQIYGFYDSITDAIQPKHATSVGQFFDGTHKFGEVSTEFAMPLEDLFQPQFLKDAIQNPNSRFRQALKANDVYQWTPKTPLRLYHGGGDIEVPTFNSQDAYEFMKSHGADVEFINLGPQVTHATGFRLAFGQAALWFESLP